MRWSRTTFIGAGLQELSDREEHSTTDNTADMRVVGYAVLTHVVGFFRNSGLTTHPLHYLDYQRRLGDILQSSQTTEDISSLSC